MYFLFFLFFCFWAQPSGVLRTCGEGHGDVLVSRCAMESEVWVCVEDACTKFLSMCLHIFAIIILFEAALPGHSALMRNTHLAQNNKLRRFEYSLTRTAHPFFCSASPKSILNECGGL